MKQRIFLESCLQKIRITSRHSKSPAEETEELDSKLLRRRKAQALCLGVMISVKTGPILRICSMISRNIKQVLRAENMRRYCFIGTFFQLPYKWFVLEYVCGSLPGILPHVANISTNLQVFDAMQQHSHSNAYAQ
jgi:hypothetical protein